MQSRRMYLTTLLAKYQRLLAEHTQPLPNLSALISLEAAIRSIQFGDYDFEVNVTLRCFGLQSLQCPSTLSLNALHL